MSDLTRESLINTDLIMQEPSVLRYAPLLIRDLEMNEHRLAPKNYFDSFIDYLAKGYTPDDWMRECANNGQVGLSMRIQRAFCPNSTHELNQIKRQWRDKCEGQLNHFIQRVESQCEILSADFLKTEQEEREEINRLINQNWFDLALKKFEELDRLFGWALNEATQERQNRYDKAQEQINLVRREMLYAEPVLRKQNTLEYAWELLSDADRISASIDCNMDHIDEICKAIHDLYQGATVNSELLEKYHAISRRLTGIVPHGAQAQQPIANNFEMLPSSGSTPIVLEHEMLLPQARSLLTQLVGSSQSLLHFDLSTASLPVDLVWKEDGAKKARSKAQTLALTVQDDQQLLKELLSNILFLLRYWTEKRKSVPEDIQTDISRMLIGYGLFSASIAVQGKRLDTALEYYHAVLRICAQLKTLQRAENAILNYFSILVYNKGTSWEQIEISNTAGGTGDEKLIEATIEYALQSSDDGRLQAVQAMARLAAEHPWWETMMNQVIELLPAEVKENQLSPAISQLNSSYKLNHTHADVATGFARFTAAFKTLQDELNDLLNHTMEESSTIHTLRNLPVLIEQIQNLQYPYMLTEQNVISRLNYLTASLPKYFGHDLTYQYRANIVDELLKQNIPTVLRMVDSSPTVLNIGYFSRITHNIRSVLEEDIATLQQVSMPHLEVSIEQKEWRADGQYYCTVRIENSGEIHADDISINVEESHNNSYHFVDDPGVIMTIPPGKAHSVHVRIQPTEDTPGTFDLNLTLKYKIPQKNLGETRFLHLRVEGFQTEKQTPQTIYNPYVVGKVVENPKLFRGRDKMIALLLHEVANPDQTGSAVIFGQKRSGKTSLLYHLKLQSPEFIIPVSFDIPSVLASLPAVSSVDDAGREEMLGRLLLAIAEKTITALEERHIHLPILTWEEIMAKPGPDFHFGEYLARVQKMAGRYRLLYLFDEFTALMKKVNELVIDQTIMDLIKSLIHRGYFSCIICGLTEMRETVTRYANQLAASQPIQVDYLDEKAAAGLIEDPIRLPDGRSRFVSKQAVDNIFNLTAGSPYYIQMLCSRLVQYMVDNGIELITAADVDEVVHEMITGNARLDIVHFDNLYRFKNTDDEGKDEILEGLVVHLLAHETTTKPAAPVSALYAHIKDFVSEEDLNHSLEQLEDRRTLLAQQTIKDSVHRRGTEKLLMRSYSIRVDLFRRWLIMNRPIDEEVLKTFRRKLLKQVKI